MAKYSYITDKSNDNRKIQVESAKRDGSGKNIENNYAKQNGFYSTLTAGKAEAIASNREIDDAEIACPPITFGIAGDEAEIQTGINNLEYLEGKSIKFNQLVDMHLNDASKYGVTFTLTNGTIHAEGTASGTGYTVCGREMLLNKTHKYLFKGFKWKSNEYTIYLYATGTGGSSGGHGTTYRVDGTTGNGIFTFNPNSGASEVSGWQIFFYMFSGVAINVTSTPQIFDLTEIYGAGNEPTTVEQFEKDFPLAYYGKDTGSIISAKSATLVSRGKNQFSALNEFIPVIGGEEYEISGISAGGVLYQYDANKNLIDTSDTFTDTVDIEMEENAAFVKISATTYEDIMFYLTFPEDGGVYGEPYVAPRVETIDLPNIELRSVGDVKDIAYASGGGLRKTWLNSDLAETYNISSVNTSHTYPVVALQLKGTYSSIKIKQPANSSTKPNLIVNKTYSVTSTSGAQSVNGGEVNKTISGDREMLYICDSAFADKTNEQILALLSGISILYELNTSIDILTTENAGWTPEVFVDNFGTLEFVTSPAQVPQVEQPYFIRYTVSLTEFLDTAYVKTKGDGNNVATQEEVDQIKDGIVKVGLAENAENLTPYSESSGATGTNPFLFQSSGGSADVNVTAHLKALRGKTIKFNQIANKNWARNYPAVTGVTVTTNDDGFLVFNGTTESESGCYSASKFGVQGHKYFLGGCPKGGSADTYYVYTGYAVGYDYGDGVIFTADRSNSYYFYIHYKSGVTFNNAVFKPQVIDLTEMFGAGNEPTTVAEFRRMFPEPYYEYNAGTLLSSKSSKIVNMGCNAYDNSNPTDYIKVIAGETYVISGTYTSVELYDVEKNLLSDEYVDDEPLPANCQYVKITGGSSDTMFRLSWDEDHDYVPYEKHEYALPNVELRSAGSVYDELTPDGKLIRRVGIVDLGDLITNQTANESNVIQVSVENLGIKPNTGYLAVCNLLCSNYSTANYSQTYSAEVKKSIAFVNDTLAIQDNGFSGKTSAEIKTLLTGVALYYELATPTEEQVSPFTEIQQIDDFGTQEFVSEETFPVPQGAEFFYPVDYKAFIDSVGGREDINYDADELVSHSELQEALAEFLSSITGYDETKTQVLKNTEGSIAWVDIEE